jgi:hypothetical protein
VGQAENFSPSIGTVTVKVVLGEPERKTNVAMLGIVSFGLVEVIVELAPLATVVLGIVSFGLVAKPVELAYLATASVKVVRKAVIASVVVALL